MGNPGDKQTLSRRQKHSQSQARRVITAIWSEWRLEIIVVILVIVAVFLLVESVPLRQMLVSGLQRGIGGLSGLIDRFLRRVSRSIQNTTLSDLIAYILLLGALIFVIFRLRWRLMTLPRFRTRECPHCHGELHRIHRRTADRMISLYVPVRRYQCKNSECRWQGLRVGTGHRQ